MIVDYKALAALYSQMTAEDFALIKREDLTKDAREYYDREMCRRVPGWHYDGPAPELTLQNLTRLTKNMKRQFIVQTTGLFGIALCSIFLYFQVPKEYSDVRTYITFVVSIMFSLVGFALWSSAYRTGYVVLWLRRFHRREQKVFQRALDLACKFLCMPVTVQDSAFRFSYGFAAGQIGRFAWLVLPIVVIAPFISNEIMTDIIRLIVYVFYSIAIGTYYWWAYTKLRREGPEKHLAKLLENIRTGTLRSAGALILRVQDSSWQQVVELAISRSDAIVIDVTEPSENVIWELKTALRLRAPQSVLLTCSTDKHSPGSPDAVRSKLPMGLDQVDLGQFPIFFYSKAGRRLERIKELREALTKCISHGPSHEN